MSKLATTLHKRIQREATARVKAGMDDETARLDAVATVEAAMTPLRSCHSRTRRPMRVFAIKAVCKGKDVKGELLMPLHSTVDQVYRAAGKKLGVSNTDPTLDCRRRTTVSMKV